MRWWNQRDICESNARAKATNARAREPNATAGGTKAKSKTPVRERMNPKRYIAVSILSLHKDRSWCRGLPGVATDGAFLFAHGSNPDPWQFSQIVVATPNQISKMMLVTPNVSVLGLTRCLAKKRSASNAQRLVPGLRRLRGQILGSTSQRRRPRPPATAACVRPRARLQHAAARAAPPRPDSAIRRRRQPRATRAKFTQHTSKCTPDDLLGFWRLSEIAFETLLFNPPGLRTTPPMP